MATTKSRTSIALAVTFGFILGAIASAALLLSYFGPSVAGGVTSLSEGFYAQREKQAFEAYRDEPPAVALWAMNNYLKELDTEFARTVLADNWSMEALIALARIAKLNSDQGMDFSKNDLAMAKAISMSEGGAFPAIDDASDLVEFANHVDSLRKQQAEG